MHSLRTILIFTLEQAGITEEKFTPAAGAA